MRPIDSESLLDRALEGEPPEVKARVRDVVIKLGIHPDDPFFIISIGLGHLQVLIEEGPKEWQSLFSSFEEVLSEWAATNLKTLSLLAQRTETMERLATSSEQLGSILIDLTQACSALLVQLPQSDGQLTSSVKQLENSSRELLGLLNSIQSRLAEQEHKIEALAQSVGTTNRLLTPTPPRGTSRRRRGTLTSIEVDNPRLFDFSSAPRKETSRSTRGRSESMGDNEISPLLFLLLLILLGVILLCGLTGISLHHSNRTARQTELLLEKATRLECLQGFQDPESAECQRFLGGEGESSAATQN